MKTNIHIQKWIEEEGLASISEQLGCSKSLISHWANGRRKIQPKSAVLIERVTLGRIKREQLLPEIFGPLRYNSKFDPRPRSATVPPTEA